MSSLSSANHFELIDYTVFVGLLTLSASVGIYYGFISKRKQNSASEYLLGGKQLQTLPVSISLIATSISGFALLGVPAEIYSQGAQYALISFSYVFLCSAIWFVYLPVFSDLQCPSLFSYLELRFANSVRLTASVVYGISIVFYVPVTIYIPSLAFYQATGISVHYVTPVACLICMFYTSFGGVRAVVWTDTLQFLSMIGGIFLVVHLGLESTPFDRVWDAGLRGGRLDINMDPNPFLRTTFWTMILGAPLSWTASSAANPSIIQRFLSLPNEKAMRNAMLFFLVGLTVIMYSNCFIGLLMYAHYEDCDPLTRGDIEKVDQILPYFIMDVASKIPGLPGLFVAGIFSAALSTMSSCWNSLAGTIYEDFIHPLIPKASGQLASNTMKVIVFILGLVTIGLVFVVERMGTVFGLVISIQGVTYGTIFGAFSFGMICRSGNTKGVISGSIVAFVLLTTVVIGAQLTGSDSTTLPLRTDGCVDLGNITTISTTTASTPGIDVNRAFKNGAIFNIFELSFMYYALIAVVAVFLVGYPVSILTGGFNAHDERLFTPWVRRRQSTADTQVKQGASPRNSRSGSGDALSLLNLRRGSAIRNADVAPPKYLQVPTSVDLELEESVGGGGVRLEQDHHSKH